LLGEEKQLLPHAQVGPADEGLSGARPGPQLSWDGAPLGPVLMPPNDRRDRAPQVLKRGFALGPAYLDQRLKAHPVRIRQHRPLLIPEGAKRPSLQTVKFEQALALQLRSCFDVGFSRSCLVGSPPN